MIAISVRQVCHLPFRLPRTTPVALRLNRGTLVFTTVGGDDDLQSVGMTKVFLFFRFTNYLPFSSFTPPRTHDAKQHGNNGGGCLLPFVDQRLAETATSLRLPPNALEQCGPPPYCAQCLWSEHSSTRRDLDKSTHFGRIEKVQCIAL